MNLSLIVGYRVWGVQHPQGDESRHQTDNGDVDHLFRDQSFVQHVNEIAVRTPYTHEENGQSGREERNGRK